MACPSLTGWKACPAAICLPDGLKSPPYGRPPSAVCIRLFVPHSLTVHLAGKPAPSPSTVPSRSAVCCPRSVFVPHSLTVCLSHRPSSPRGLPSAVRGLYSFIRSPFVDGPPCWKARPITVHRPFAVCRLLSAVCIRSPFVDGLPLASSIFPPRPAVCRPRSVFSFPIR
jgi:hypothetical protein